MNQPKDNPHVNSGRFVAAQYRLAFPLFSSHFQLQAIKLAQRPTSYTAPGPSMPHSPSGTQRS
jgi:hypothetical protein